MVREDWDELLDEVNNGLAINDSHLELNVLKAVALANTGKKKEAQALIDRTRNVRLLQYHLHHYARHPLRRAVEKLKESSITIPTSGPLYESTPTPAPTPVIPNDSKKVEAVPNANVETPKEPSGGAKNGH